MSRQVATTSLSSLAALVLLAAPLAGAPWTLGELSFVSEPSFARAPRSDGQPAPDSLTFQPRLADDAVSVSGGGNLTGAGVEGWQLGLSASQNADPFLSPATERAAALEAMAFRRSFESRGFVRVGRYAPEQLRAVGRLDGVHGEVRVKDGLATGVMAGFRSRSSAEISADEPVAMAYLLTNLADNDNLRYSGAYGLVGTAFEGDADRTAVLVEQAATLAQGLELNATTEIDLDAFSDVERNAAPLTRLSLSMALPVSNVLKLSAGVRREKRPDTKAERELAGGDEGEYTEGTWRHWVGAARKLPWDIQAEGEVSFRDAVRDSENTPDGRLRLSRSALPFVPSAGVEAGLYTHGVGSSRGTAGRLSGKVGLLSGSVSLRPSVTVDLDAPQDDDARENALAFHMEWRPRSELQVVAGATYRADEFAEQSVVELGFRQMW